ncbi:ABC transporter substrate-binding protein [Nakamurella sp. PAMC28650]|uniref:ABC transporter substrate-binding protein n=1 Tax=Nakamurella sp. PAMC28650 TaxID=2762325 RepID=UPI00164DBD25|nr:ABC transporter substrate-binding protein [Nakamurella sp. PAMC28650]QNK82957.1 ABC transporter substrate-binding protein [Nakamurella sp. PAMC28650]
MNRTHLAFVGAIAAAALAVTACGSSSSTGSAASSSSVSSAPAAGSPAPAAGGGSITIGSANFAESVLLMDVYAEALRAKGITVTTKPKIGAREVYIPAIKDGSIDLIPEYSGTLLAYVDTTSKAASSADIYAALPAVLKPSGLEVLAQSQAQDKDAIAVSAATAAKYSLKTIADLAAHAGSLIIGAGPEFKTRADGVAGLKSTYGVTFQTFKTLDSGGPLTVAALKNGQIDAADLFTTDPAVPAYKFVLLQDPKNLYTAQNVLPLISSKKVTPTITSALNAVSAKLDTATLTALDKQVYGGTDPDAVAKTWIKANGLG